MEEFEDDYEKPKDERVGYNFNLTTADQFGQHLRHDQILTSWILQGYSENPYVEEILKNFNFMKKESRKCPLEKVGVN